jgi:hypothetical protein
MGRRFCLVLLLLAGCTNALAAANAVVEALQAPAWVEREGKREREPLVPGAQLRAGDQILTGVESRALLRLPDGSRIKLGENGALKVQDLALRQQGGRLLRATLQVLQGAFRFTTDVASRAAYRREVDVQFNTITAGIRGTDLWGRNFGDREVVVLLEGEIEVKRAGNPAVKMTQPLHYYQAPASGAARVEPIAPELLREWAQQTELGQGGAQSVSGKWKLELARFPDQDAAVALYDSLRRDGYPARIHPYRVEGAPRYTLRLSGFASREEALALGTRLKEGYPVIEPRALR